MVAVSAKASMVPRVVTNLAQLESLRDEWDALLARSTANEPSRSPLWVCAWWRVFGASGRRLRVVTCRYGGRLVAVIPLCTRLVGRVPGLRIKRLELIPSGEEERDEIASDYIGPVVEPGFEQRVAEAFARLAAGGAFGVWDELVMSALGVDGPQLALTMSALESIGSIDVSYAGGSPYIPLPDSWDAYLAALASGRRRAVRTALRAFDAWTSGAAALHVARSQAELEHGIRVLRDLHEARWRSAGERGVFHSEKFSAFHAEVMPQLFSRDALELMWLCRGNQPVAALYNIVWNGKVYFYQSGRQIDVPKGIRPGIVLHALAIRRAIELGRREYDFLRGTSRYKQELSLAVHPLVRVRVRRRGQVERVLRGHDRARSIWRAMRM